MESFFCVMNDRTVSLEECLDGLSTADVRNDKKSYCFHCNIGEKKRRNYAIAGTAKSETSVSSAHSVKSRMVGKDILVLETTINNLTQEITKKEKELISAENFLKNYKTQEDKKTAEPHIKKTKYDLTRLQTAKARAEARKAEAEAKNSRAEAEKIKTAARIEKTRAYTVKIEAKKIAAETKRTEAEIRRVKAEARKTEAEAKTKCLTEKKERPEKKITTKKVEIAKERMHSYRLFILFLLDEKKHFFLDEDLRAVSGCTRKGTSFDCWFTNISKLGFASRGKELKPNIYQKSVIIIPHMKVFNNTALRLGYDDLVISPPTAP